MYAYRINHDINNNVVNNFEILSQNALHHVRNNNMFTTKWYIDMINNKRMDELSMNDEISLLERNNGGNCVGLSLLVQKELEKHGIKSSRIISSCPERIYMKGQKQLSHCACAFYTPSHIYIIDVGFLFTTPIIIDRETGLGSGIWKCDKLTGRDVHVRAKLNKHYLVDNVEVVNCYSGDDIWQYILAEPYESHKSISLPHAQSCIDNNRTIVLADISVKNR